MKWKQKSDPHLTPYIKIISKWIKYLNVKHEIVAEIWDSIFHTLKDGFLKQDNENTEKFNYSKIRNFCSSGDTIKRVKTQIMNLEKISETQYWKRV